jgi:hypothetical protein
MSATKMPAEVGCSITTLRVALDRHDLLEGRHGEPVPEREFQGLTDQLAANGRRAFNLAGPPVDLTVDVDEGELRRRFEEGWSISPPWLTWPAARRGTSSGTWS